MEELCIFSGNANPALAMEIAGHIGIELSSLDIQRFSNDNIYVKVLKNVRERDVFVVQSFSEPVNYHIMELFIIMDALRSASARRITAVIPYYSYARSDKKDAPRISIAGRLMADLLQTAGANRVLTMDLHSDAVHGFFSIPVDHLTAIPLIAHHVRKYMDLSRAVAVATDAGGAKRVGKFANYLDIPMAFIDKRRIADQEVEQGLVVGDVKGRQAIIFDDEISTGGTLVATARTLIQNGVERMIMGATHPVLCGDAVENLKRSGVERFFVTNTVSVCKEKQFTRINRICVASLISEAIKRIHTGESVGALFEKDLV